MSKANALKVMTGLLSAVLLFHLAVLFQLIPYQIVWAGKLESVEEMRVFESVSIVINIMLIFVLRVKANNLKNGTTNRVINGLIWIFIVLFGLNTVGNLFSKNWIELVFGTALTLISSLLLWVIVRKEKAQP